MLNYTILTMETWKRYKNLIIDSENVFPEKIRSEEEDFIEILEEGNYVGLIAFYNDTYIGNALGFGMTKQEMDEYEIKHTNKNIFYFLTFVILPEFQGRGFGRLLIEEFINQVKKGGYDLISGHFRKNNSFNLIKKLGAKEVKICENWEGTGEEFIYCELDLK